LRRSVAKVSCEGQLRRSVEEASCGGHTRASSGCHSTPSLAVIRHCWLESFASSDFQFISRSLSGAARSRRPRASLKPGCSHCLPVGDLPRRNQQRLQDGSSCWQFRGSSIRTQVLMIPPERHARFAAAACVLRRSLPACSRRSAGVSRIERPACEEGSRDGARTQNGAQSLIPPSASGQDVCLGFRWRCEDEDANLSCAPAAPGGGGGGRPLAVAPAF
jgi:hypothetical protein